MLEESVEHSTLTRRIAQGSAWANNVLGFIDRTQWLVPSLLVAFIFVVSLVASSAKPLWHDELFTFYIAQAPDLHTLFRDLASLDLNPPLIYLLIRAVFHFLTPSETTARIPSIIGFSMAVWCLYKAAAGRGGWIAGLLAASVLIMSNASEYAVEARPYGLLLGFFGVALLGWQGQTEKHKVTNLVLILLGVSGMLFCHVFAILAWGALVAGELTRVLFRRRIEWLTWIALVAPMPIVLSYKPLFKNHGTAYYPTAFQVHLGSVYGFYSDITWLYVLPVLILLGFSLSGTNFREERPSAHLFSVPEITSAAALFLSPMLLMLYLFRSHGAFFSRYGLVAYVGFALLLAAFGTYAKTPRTVLFLFCLFLLANSALNRSAVTASVKFIKAGALRRTVETSSLHQPPVPNGFLPALEANGSLPVVDASGLAFVEMNAYEPTWLLNRLYYLTNPSASLEFAHANIFEGMAREKAAFGFKAAVQSYSDFLATNKRFFVIGTYNYSEDWLLRKLNADGASLALRGIYNSQYLNHELYEVTVAPR